MDLALSGSWPQTLSSSPRTFTLADLLLHTDIDIYLDMMMMMMMMSNQGELEMPT